MQKTKVVWYVLITFLVGAGLLAFNAGVVWSTSVDLAHHYALVFRLAENWQMTPNDPSLVEMNIYPRGSHIAAVLAGIPLGSPFLGMHMVALGSLVLLWASCLAILYAAPGRKGPLTALVLALLLVVNHGALRVHGAEISGAYHYAQLVAQALVFAVLAIAVRLDGRVHRIGVYAFLLVANVVVVGVHLLPALELLGVLAGLLLLDAVAAPAAQRLRTVLAGVVLLAIGIATVVLHPSFAAMRAISAHNGGMSLGLLGPIWSLALASLIVLATVVPLLRTWQRDRPGSAMPKYLAVYGMAIAGLCLLQIVLRYFNLGSDYAVKKYAYVLASFLVIRLAMWLGAKATARAERRPGFARLPGAFDVGVFGLALAIAVLGCARMRHDVDAYKVASFERQLVDLRAGAARPVPQGKPTLVAELDGMHVAINYMFSLAVMHTPREVVLPYFTTGMDPGPLSQYGLIVTSPGQPRFAAAQGCVRSRAGALVVLDGACAEQAAQAGSANTTAAAR
jgi:hypothetical protein